MAVTVLGDLASAHHSPRHSKETEESKGRASPWRTLIRRKRHVQRELDLWYSIDEKILMFDPSPFYSK